MSIFWRKFLITGINRKWGMLFIFHFVVPALVSTANAQASFTIPDTVCVGTPVRIINNSVRASSHFWNFSNSKIFNSPTLVNMGNLDQRLSAPVYIDYVFENGKYYGFMTNNWPGGLLRLEFGKSLLNTPAVTDLGDVDGVIPNNTEGIQIVKNENKWYVIIVGGDPEGGTSSRIVKIELGASITNNHPEGTNWGNLGKMSYPHDLHIFEEKGKWYGFTLNSNTNTITRFHFTSSFSNKPTAENLGNIGKLKGPTGIFLMKENNSWYAFVANNSSSTLTRLNFGNSLLNTPKGVNLGNIGETFHQVWDIHLIQYCGKILGYAINAQSGYSNVVKLDFGGSLTNSPTAKSFNNNGYLDFPHSFSKTFRVGEDLYSFIPSVSNHSLSRIKFPGDNKSSIPTSILKNPPPVTYKESGTFNISLSINDGLPGQSTLCRQVVVIPSLKKAPLKIYTVCKGQSLKISSPKKDAKYLWNTGDRSESIDVSKPGNYWIESTRFGCTVRDRILVKEIPSLLDFSFSQDTCDSRKIQFHSGLDNNATITWSFGDDQVESGVGNPNIIYKNYGTFKVRLTAENKKGCVETVEKIITVKAPNLPAVVLNDRSWKGKNAGTRIYQD